MVLWNDAGTAGRLRRFANKQQIGLESFTPMQELRTEVLDTIATDPRDMEVSRMLLTMLRSLVDKTDELDMVELADGQGVSFQVRSAADDLGKLIGKNGRTARAIRTILGASAAKHGRRYSLDLAASPRGQG
jgi:uncharacterized protein